MPVPWTGIHCDRKLLPAPDTKGKNFFCNYNFVHKKNFYYMGVKWSLFPIPISKTGKFTKHLTSEINQKSWVHFHRSLKFKQRGNTFWCHINQANRLSDHSRASCDL
uniref:Uncharacterized protein n=1 Tax=Anguilla anguilla TaxID=7936 RepID=A0A0E9UA72_ANGAN